MANVTVWGPYVYNTASENIPPKGTLYFWIGPHPAINDSTVTVTAHGLGFVSGPQFLEVVQTATRASPGGDRHLDIVVRNNTPRHCPYTRVYVSLIKP
jgi:hypothetical protein